MHGNDNGMGYYTSVYVHIKQEDWHSYYQWQHGNDYNHVWMNHMLSMSIPAGKISVNIASSG